MKPEGKNMIGHLTSADGQKFFNAINPVTSRKLEPQFFEATFNEIDRAVKRAHEAFQIYRNFNGNIRAEFLACIAEEIIALDNVLIQRCMEETGLPEARLLNERQRTVNQLNMFAAYLNEGSWVDARVDYGDPERKPIPKPDIRSMQKALGPVGIFGSSNFPFAFSVAGGDTASALAAGCTVVVKAHPAHPGTSELVGHAILQAIKKCKMPDGTFSLVQGASHEVGLGIVRHPFIKAIGFTGSFRGGKALFDEAGARPEPIPVYAEMGSTNPVFILPGILQDRRHDIARDLASSVTLGVGQFCTNPGLVFIQESSHANEFTTTLSKHIEDTPAGTMLTEGIQKNYLHGTNALNTITGVEKIASGKSIDSGFSASAQVFESDVKGFLANQMLEEEIFGPSTLLISAGDKNEILLAAQKLHGHLTATIHGTREDFRQYADLIHILEQKVGRLIINGYPTGVEVCHAMVHGGPFPATTDSRTTSVGTMAITRFTRPVCYQNFPEELLPEELKTDNPKKIWRLINGKREKN
ncbi:MAG TPA: aldehyde dehydrogenase (NADP(+)) [Cyclobacteriaceae bacterium]|nr:aldehyde dehydrogenase (NADP(+)) [Cyclobacteriaceae bacterium]